MMSLIETAAEETAAEETAAEETAAEETAAEPGQADPHKPEPPKKPLPTIWNVPDPLWELIARVLAVYDPPKKTGRRRSDERLAFDGVIYRMRTGCQWNHLPKDFGDDSSVHRAFTRWEQKGIFDILWAILLTKCDDLQVDQVRRLAG